MEQQRLQEGQHMTPGREPLKPRKILVGKATKQGFCQEYSGTEEMSTLPPEEISVPKKEIVESDSTDAVTRNPQLQGEVPEEKRGDEWAQATVSEGDVALLRPKSPKLTGTQGEMVPILEDVSTQDCCVKRGTVLSAPRYNSTWGWCSNVCIFAAKIQQTFGSLNLGSYPLVRLTFVLRSWQGQTRAQKGGAERGCLLSRST